MFLPSLALTFKILKGYFFFGYDGHQRFYGISRITPQIDMPGPYGDKLFYLAGYCQIDPRSAFVIGINAGGFPHFSTAISLGIDFQGNFPLAAGGDLSRIRDSRTPSAGFYAIHR